LATHRLFLLLSGMVVPVVLIVGRIYLKYKL
jgi:hypothetical protein